MPKKTNLTYLRYIYPTLNIIQKKWFLSLQNPSTVDWILNFFAKVAITIDYNNNYYLSSIHIEEY